MEANPNGERTAQQANSSRGKAIGEGEERNAKVIA